MGSPKIKNLIVRIIPDATSRMLELRKGGIDMMELAPAQFSQQVDKNGVIHHFNKYRSPSFRYGFLGFNLLDKRFGDKRIRQAISYGIDKDAIIRAVLMGLGGRSNGPYPQESLYAGKKAKYFNYNPVKAMELFKEAGWGQGADGILRKNGHPFSFTIITNYESEENSKTAQIIQNNLKALGIEVKITQLEWQTFRHIVINKHEFEAVILSRAYIWDPDLFDLWHSSRTKEGEWNFFSYRNPDVDGLLEEGRRTIDVEQRKRIYRRLHEIMAEEQPCVFLYNADGLFIAQKRIQDIAPSPLGIYHKVPKLFISQ